jgi:hypothetical protein
MSARQFCRSSLIVLPSGESTTMLNFTSGIPSHANPVGQSPVLIRVVPPRQAAPPLVGDREPTGVHAPIAADPGIADDPAFFFSKSGSAPTPGSDSIMWPPPRPRRSSSGRSCQLLPKSSIPIAQVTTYSHHPPSRLATPI